MENLDVSSELCLKPFARKHQSRAFATLHEFLGIPMLGWLLPYQESAFLSPGQSADVTENHEDIMNPVKLRNIQRGGAEYAERRGENTKKNRYPFAREEYR